MEDVLGKMEDVENDLITYSILHHPSYI